MIYALDTEFMEDGKLIELLSIGLVAEDGREFYRQMIEADHGQANTFVRQHVMPHLEPCPSGFGKNQHWSNWKRGGCVEGCPWVLRKDCREQLQAFCGKQPVFVGYFASYDWVAFCQLFGCMIDLPEGWPMYCHDLRALLDQMGRQDVTEPDDIPHHALLDARWVMQTWKRFYPGNTR